MSIAAIMEEMAEAGAPMAAIIIAVRAIEAAQAAGQAGKEKARDRKRLQREREREAVTVTGQSRDMSQTDPLPLSSPQTPHQSPTPVKTKPTHVRATRLTDSWQPASLTGEAGEIAVLRGAEWVSLELTKFRNHWISKSGSSATKTDWQRTWANWLLQANEWRPTQQRTQSTPSPSSDLQGLLKGAEKYKNLEPLRATGQAA